MKKIKILHVVGARPNFIKAAPVMGALSKRGGIPQTLVHTGQHYDSNMSEVFFRQLDLAEPGERIMCVSYGSGAGSDAFSFVVTDEITKKRDLAPITDDYILDKEMLNYAVYAKHRGKILMD